MSPTSFLLEALCNNGSPESKQPSNVKSENALPTIYHQERLLIMTMILSVKAIMMKILAILVAVVVEMIEVVALLLFLLFLMPLPFFC